jgi:hypothetical protein
MKNLSILIVFILLFVTCINIHAEDYTRLHCMNSAAYLKADIGQTKDGKIMAKISDNYLHGDALCEKPKGENIFESIYVCKGKWKSFGKQDYGKIILHVSKLRSNKTGKPEIVAAMVRSKVYTGLPIAMTCISDR